MGLHPRPPSGCRLPPPRGFEDHGQAARSKVRTLPAEFSLSSSTLQAAAALSFPWSEFGMSAPSVGGFVTVTGTATMEFDLRLQRA